MMFTTKKTTQTGRGWLTLPAIADVFDVTPQGFAKTIRPLIPPEAIKGEGAKGLRIHARAAIDAWAQHIATQAAADAKKTADPLLIGADSPALERYRNARADGAELDLAERRRELVPLGRLWPTLERFAAAIRRAGETLQRRFGIDAAFILNDALDEARRVAAAEQEAGQ